MSTVEKDAVRAAVPWANLNPMPLPAIASGSEWRDVPEAFKDIGALQKTSDGKSASIRMKDGITHQSPLYLRRTPESGLLLRRVVNSLVTTPRM